jgi:hypothetical protein
LRLRSFACFAILGVKCAFAHAQQTMVITGDAPPQFSQAAEQAGYQLQPAEGHWPESANIAVIETESGWAQAKPLDRNATPDEQRADAAAQRTLDAEITSTLADADARLREGKTLIISLGRRNAALDKFQSLLPVNTWSFADDASLLRSDSGATAPAGSPLSDVPLQNFLVSSRFDLHLPYAAIEAGEHRYRFVDYPAAKDGSGPFPSMEKGLFNTDYRVLLNSNQDGQLPLLVEGRYHGGHVLVFGADLYDASLIHWNQYGAFISRLLAASAPAELASPAPISGLTLGIQAVQASAASLHVDVASSSDHPIHAILLCKVANSEHALLNSLSIPITVDAGKTESIPIPERTDLLGDPGIHASADAAAYRIIDAALCPTDYNEASEQAHAIVDIHPPVTLDIHTQDYRTFDDLATFPERDMGRGYDVAGGAPIDRYIFTTGAAPEFTIRLSNALHNIAPLAQAADIGHPENISAQGLNDLAFSNGSLRGLWPLYGGWYGLPSSDQEVQLKWAFPVTLAASEVYGYGPYRQWNTANPENFDLIASSKGSDVRLASVQNAVYTVAMHRDDFKATAADAVALKISGIADSPRGEPGSLPGKTTNCSIEEWKILGWPGTALPPAISGHLIATATDVVTGKLQQLLDEPIELDPLTQAIKTFALPAHADEGAVRIDVAFKPDSGPATAANATTNIFFIPPNRPHLTQQPPSTMGLLCAPGFVAFDPFGTGTNADTQGWGGPDDNVWSVVHDFMEEGAGSVDDPRRMLTTAMRFSHYTDPWRDFPSGEYYFDFATDRLIDMIAAKAIKTAGYIRLFLADRWNGIPIGAQFTWDDFIRFDQYLRKTTGHGLESRTRKTISAEIRQKYADKFQVFELNRYADALLDAQKRLAAKGYDFSVTTHGSFPLVGGEIGQKIAKTHRYSGTDVFWELKAEDLWYSLGNRFGLIAANPDYESGMYNEWGWASGKMNNIHWFSYTGTCEPARRQWYATYFMGRVNSAGEFLPLTMVGADSQGAFGVKNTGNDWEQYYRTQQFTDKVRPESPAGLGLVVSWNEQIRHMGPEGGDMGTGYYASAGHEQVDAIGGKAFSELVKAGVPISFVASTDTLKSWKSAQPLIAADGLEYDPTEIATLTRLNNAGAPIIGVGGADEASSSALNFFGVRKGDNGLEPAEGTKVIQAGGIPIAYIHRSGGAPTLACPIDPAALTDTQSTALAAAISDLLGDPLELSPGLAAVAFQNGNNLYLALSDQGDVNRDITVSVRPDLLAAGKTFSNPHVIDLDRAIELPAKESNGQLTFSLPCAASDGRMIEITNQ